MRTLPAITTAFAAALWAIRLTNPANADDTLVIPVPEQVVTATRVPTPISDIPAGVTVITRAEIEAKGYDTLTQALSGVPGVHVSPSGGQGGQASVFIRGTNANHVLVLRDGMPITDAADPAQAFNFGIDTLSDIERIEVIRGPMASVYGSGAIGGVINLISRRGTEQGMHWCGDVAGGYPALVRGTVGASGIEEPNRLRGAHGRKPVTSRLRPRHPAAAVQHPYTGTRQGFRDRIATLNLGYTPVEGTRLSLFLRGQIAYFGYNTLGSPTFDDSNSNGQVGSLEGYASADRPNCSMALSKATPTSASCRLTANTSNHWPRRIPTRSRPTRVTTRTKQMRNGTTWCISMTCSRYRP